jgi:hypothetical protein
MSGEQTINVAEQRRPAALAGFYLAMTAGGGAVFCRAVDWRSLFSAR